ncbi:MAG: SMP-30/gluconolactonase/LRE family protein [Candidatus Tectomicrobia bacterium]|uniref:SMP-30/gluconolactonase/LRE family protein n=1 Tax=Tectimicrobiota bacterium TaxID=2528274 RepID=A0A932GP67_UNCTE|nr:SMP-30/gluconolactonase/LRE family protein [Candidatus Tectomicrobia bacterium]
MIRVAKKLLARWVLLGIVSLLAAAAGAISFQPQGEAAQAVGRAKKGSDAQLQAQLQEKERIIAQLQQQLKSMAPSIVIQAGQLQAAPQGAPPSGWDTETSLKANVRLIATYDSSGPNAWDPAKHPLVFITSEGKGYAGTYSKTYKLAGLQIIDANTKEVVTSASYDLGFKKMMTPHGLGISPDGKWLYVPTGDGDQPWTVEQQGGTLLIVNARTLKLDKVLSTPVGPHHVNAFRDWKGRDRVLVEADQTRILLDPNDDHRIVMTFGTLNFNALPYQSDVDPSGRYIYSGLILGGRSVADKLAGAVGKLDLASGRVKIIPGVGMYPNGFAFTSDGKYTYVSDSSGSRIYKIDNSTDTVVGSTQSGVPGPYNIALNWDETELWVIGKGEMSFNLGGSLGLVNTKTFTTVREFPIGGQTIDHNTLHPDVSANEMWITSSGTLETIVFDLGKRQVKARIPSANGGDTHSGGFVRYNPDFTGELLADQGGIHNSMLAQKKSILSSSNSRR